MSDINLDKGETISGGGCRLKKSDFWSLINVIIASIAISISLYSVIVGSNNKNDISDALNKIISLDSRLKNIEAGIIIAQSNLETLNTEYQIYNSSIERLDAFSFNISEAINALNEGTVNVSWSLNEIKSSLSNYSIVISNIDESIKSIEGSNSNNTKILDNINIELNNLINNISDISDTSVYINQNISSFKEDIRTISSNISGLLNKVVLNEIALTGVSTSLNGTLSALKLNINGVTNFTVEFPVRCNWLPSTSPTGFDETRVIAKMLDTTQNYNSGSLFGSYYPFETGAAMSLSMGCSAIFPGFCPAIFLSSDKTKIAVAKCNSSGDLNSLSRINYDCLPSSDYRIINVNKCLRENIIYSSNMMIKLISDLSEC